ncbi:unnamed protein product [Larinioides sclopetarius]|uniref:LAGLIDADG homing endonuclease n=1 Tax=Larinioides sclopetarius TaxID=280406 RepID=A0AAV1YSU9_9ARAC
MEHFQILVSCPGLKKTQIKKFSIKYHKLTHLSLCNGLYKMEAIVPAFEKIVTDSPIGNNGE